MQRKNDRQLQQASETATFIKYEGGFWILEDSSGTELARATQLSGLPNAS